eukprot:GEMP01001597.1.p1 GENE.GEMP01001597.1~~GEMP01001597.1.p1  ORF type:complete len:740 (+),score=84.75 GEMP01001597.1:122-2341(+)
MKATALFLAIHCVVAGMTKQLTDVETSSQSGANIYLPSRDLDKKSRNLKAGAESPNRRTRRILTTETASAATTPMANDIRTPETTETPPSTPAPTPTPTPASAATETRDYFVSVKVLVVVNVHDFDVSPMLAATTEEALQSNFENGLNKISDFEQRAGADIQLNRVMRTTTTRMLGELLKQKKVENSLHSNDDDPYSRLRENSSLSDGLPANTSTNILTDGATTETISRWLPCGYAPRRCQYPDSCVRADRGSPCKQFQLPRHSIKQFVDFWDSEYEDCRCLPNITGNLLNSASYSLPAYFGPNVGVGRLSAFYNFPKCSSTSLKIGNQRALSAAHCWCGVQFLICHPLQECWIKEDRPELSRCVLPPRGHHDYLTRWIGGRGFPLCSEEETLVNKNYFHLLCKCQSVAQIGDVTYCMRGQRCLRSPSDGPIGCQSVYAACVTNRTSTKDVCYCKERACAYKEICQIVNGTGHCIPDLSILCPQNYHSVLRTFIQCENGSVINAISDTCSNDEKIQWCPKDWPFLCNNRSTCVMHPEVCGDNGVHPCACANTTSVCESCTNEKKDNDEHAVDCGGRLCAPCDECFLFQNCSSNACPSTSVCEIDSHADCKDDCIDQCARNGCLRLQARGAKGVCMEECNIDACRLDHAVCSGYGCTDNTALNFNTIAVDDDGSCVFAKANSIPLDPHLPRSATMKKSAAPAPGPATRRAISYMKRTRATFFMTVSGTRMSCSAIPLVEN